MLEKENQDVLERCWPWRSWQASIAWRTTGFAASTVPSVTTYRTGIHTKCKCHGKMYFSLGIPNQAHWLPETYFLFQESWQNVALVVFSAKLRILVVARLSVQGCDLNTRIVSCRRRLAPRSYRRKCQHVQSRLDLAANISYNIGFQRNASLMIRLRSTECLHSDLAIKSSQTYNINLLDVALIACSIFMGPVALITESVQHVHLIERRWQNSSRRCWRGVTCLFMGGHFSKYWARP